MSRPVIFHMTGEKGVSTFRCYIDDNDKHRVLDELTALLLPVMDIHKVSVLVWEIKADQLTARQIALIKSAVQSFDVRGEKWSGEEPTVAQRLAQIPPHLWKIMLLIPDHSDKEIAERTGRPLSTVRTYHKRINALCECCNRHQLKIFLNKAEQEGLL